MEDCLYTANKGIDCQPAPSPAGSPSAGELAQSMRERLSGFLHRLETGGWPLLPLAAPNPWVSQGAGHFHLAAELFIQLSGWTQFEFPHTRLRLEAGEAILLPPRLLHEERIGPAENGTPFSNMVVYAEGGGLRCHLACETEPGVPGIAHLELQYHAKAQRIHDWLIEASQLNGGAAEPGSVPIESRQARGLLAAAIAGVLETLDAAAPDSRAAGEPPLVSRVRVFVQNQLGDHQLSVRRLAEQARCTPDYLSNVFSVATGEHLTAFINRQRIERAARLLRESALTSKEIAWACGFATQTYFIRTFRARMGVTPKIWKMGNAAGNAAIQFA
ncbi:MAG: AraC family transcriptional regulator [Propionivibrio sp.]